MKWSIFFSNIIIHVGVMALFLTVFFFTIAQYFEKKIIEDQIDFVIDDFVGKTFNSISTTNKNDLKHKINEQLSKQDFKSLDDSVKKDNKKIANKAWLFVGILVAIIFIIVLIFGFIFKWDSYYIKFLINTSILSLIFVALTETLFMFLIAQNYLSADPLKIKLNIIKTIGKNTCNLSEPNCIHF